MSKESPRVPKDLKSRLIKSKNDLNWYAYSTADEWKKDVYSIINESERFLSLIDELLIFDGVGDFIIAPSLSEKTQIKGIDHIILELKTMHKNNIDDVIWDIFEATNKEDRINLTKGLKIKLTLFKNSAISLSEKLEGNKKTKEHLRLYISN